MKKAKIIQLTLFLLLACLLVSCKKGVNVIDNIKQVTDKALEKPPLIVSEDPPEELEVETTEPLAEETEEVIQVHKPEWKTIYLDLLDYSVIESEYGEFLLFDDKLNGIENILLYDLDQDGIPELFVEGGYESTCIYSIKDDKVVLLDEIIPGTMDIRKDLKTNKKTLYVSSLLEGDGGMFYLSTLDMEAGKIIYDILFGKYMSFEESENEYYLNVKDSKETLDQAFMGFDRGVSKEVYEQAMAAYESSDQVVGQVKVYDTPMYDEESFDAGLEMFKNALEDYDRNNN